MEDLSKIELFVGGRPIATMAEMQAYAYGIPEDQVGPAIITRFIADEEVDPGELYRAVVGEGRECVAGDSAALEVIYTVAERLRGAFPTLTAYGRGAR